MTSIVTRTGKGSPLSISELDANFTNLNTDKVEKTRVVGVASGDLTVTNGGALNQDIELGLPNTGVSAGTLNNSATQTTPFTVDAKGRVTGTSAPVTLTPDFANVANKPTTLAGYGIADAQPTITGAASTIDTEDLTASRALASNSSGKVVATSITATELGYLSGVGQNLQTQLDGKQGTAGKDQANGYAGLNSSGKLSDAVLPDLAISDYLGEVADEAAMLALTGQKGDWCTRVDAGTIYVITGNPASAGGWMQMSYPGTPVKSVAGKTGIVTLDKVDVGLSALTNDAQLKIDSNLSDLSNAATARTNLGLGNVDNTSDASKPISTATQTALNLKQDAASAVTLTGTQTLTNKTISGSSNTLSDIANASLSNSAITFGATSQALGSTVSALNGVSLGQGTNGAAAGKFTTLEATGNTTLGDASGDTVAIQAGTAALPTLIPAGDTNTGLWFPAADTIAASTAGSERLRITSAGNVGIGVSSPDVKVVVHTFSAGLTAGNTQEVFRIGDRGDSASDSLRIYLVRDTTTTDLGQWFTQSIRLERNIDGAASQSGIDFSPSVLKFRAGGAQKGFIDTGKFVLNQSSNATNTSVSFNTTVQNALTLDASGNLQVFGGVTLGTGNVSIKVKKITGTLSSSTNTLTTYAHGIGDRFKILSVSARADITEAAQVFFAHQNPDSSDNGGAYYFRLADIDNSNIALVTGSNSAFVLGKPVKITIIYEA